MVSELDELVCGTALLHLRNADIPAAPHVPMAKVTELSKKAWDRFGNLWAERSSDETNELLLPIEQKLTSVCLTSLGIAAMPTSSPVATAAVAARPKASSHKTNLKQWYVTVPAVSSCCT